MSLSAVEKSVAVLPLGWLRDHYLVSIPYFYQHPTLGWPEINLRRKKNITHLEEQCKVIYLPDSPPPYLHNQTRKVLVTSRI